VSSTLNSQYQTLSPDTNFASLNIICPQVWMQATSRPIVGSDGSYDLVNFQLRLFCLVSFKLEKQFIEEWFYPESRLVVVLSLTLCSDGDLL